MSLFLPMPLKGPNFSSRPASFLLSSDLNWRSGGVGGAGGTANAGREPMVGVEAEKLTALVRWMCEASADGVVIAKAAPANSLPKLEKPIRVRVFGDSSGEAPIATLTLGLVKADGSPATGALVAIDGQVVREFRSPAAMDLYAWLQQSEASASKDARR